ncbi:MAG: CHASE2 domain-containing protein [Elainellaceae cyanobacterium]
MTGKLITLKLDGQLQTGFRVTLEIGADGDRPYLEMNGQLPAAPNVLQALRTWQTSYRGLQLITRIRPKSIRYKGSLQQLDDCRQTAHTLSKELVHWLASAAFRPLDQRLREELSRSEPIRILIRTADPSLYQLPWHYWDVVERYPNSEVAFGGMAFERSIKRPARTTGSNVKILAILGHQEGIDVETDRRLLRTLDAEISVLIEPQRQTLNDRLWDQSWDILFFAGHSQTEGETGRIYINPTDSLTLEELQYGLRQAIAKGLHLAIFNSCDGLGLAEELKPLNLPQMIVMRQPVPDRVAQQFLTYFLRAYANGEALYSAVRQAREQLQGLEKEFPCASWLPIIYQHLAAPPLTWDQLQGQAQRQDSPVPPLPESQTPVTRGLSEWQQPDAAVTDGHSLFKPKRYAIPTGVLISLAVTGLVTLARWGGLLEAVELSAYDGFMHLAPVEAQDDRLLIITIDDQDIQYQVEQGMPLQGSLSNQALAALTETLQPFEPQSVGLDLYRPNGLQLQPSEFDLPVFAICKVPAAEGGDPHGVEPPPDMPLNQIGFSDFVADDDGILRRQLLAIKNLSPTSRCTTSNAFNLLLSLYYLQDAEGIAYKLTPDQEFQFGDVVLKRLTPNAGGYHNVDASGYQLLLNYRHHRSPDDIAPTLPLRHVLSGEVPPASIEKLKGRIVLVGITALTSGDTWVSPYSKVQPDVERRIPGVVMQAQMVSQVLSAVLDGRPLVWWWPEWLEIVWMGGWVAVGAVLASMRWGNLQLIVATGLSLAALTIISYGLFLYGGWVPLIPPAIALVMTVVLIDRWLRGGALRKQHHSR